ncbi:MAG: type II secretion system protein [Candidatus Gottesmanbacteria bacterium]|nr:type II secretion system protein [Candidatus Gottesmanbacteria bacterium]
MKRTGFSLIELLVVISIIASIVALAIPNYLSARQRASDVKKKEEMAALKTALRIYYNDFNKYPCGVLDCSGVGNGFNMFGCGVDGTTACSATASFATGAAGDNIYMKSVPKGFLASPYTYKYYQKSGGDDFCLSAVLDNLSDPDIAISISRCASSCGANCSAAAPGRYCVCAD